MLCYVVRMLQPIVITPSAANRIRHLQQKRGNPALMLRLAVDGGGCSGFQYKFSFTDARNADDHLYSADDVSVVVDETSLEFLSGATLDYVEQMIGASFAIKNPQATSGCGCGSSFAVG